MSSRKLDVAVMLPQPVYGSRSAKAGDIDFHVHLDLELVLVTKGRCTIQLMDKELEGRRHDLFVLPGNVAHNQRNAVYTKTTYVVLRCQERFFDPSPRVIRIPPGHPFLRWMEDLSDLLRHPDHLSETSSGGLLLALLSELNEIERQRSESTQLHPGLVRALKYMEEHLEADMDMAGLARQAFLSASHLTALFRAEFECGPLQYLQKMRMAQARRLLRQPYHSVQEVAYACGYPDANYFVRLFRKHHGLPPAKWRKKQVSG